MMKGKMIMKYLEIKNGKGYFINQSSECKTIDFITKEDILYLLDEATNPNKSFEMDSIDEKTIHHEAHQIIYKDIYNKFQEILVNKTRFIEESEKIYKDELEKYK